MSFVKYSIIIPHYNTPILLERCVKSIPESDEFQIIVVDDNSPDSNRYVERYECLRRKNVILILLDEKHNAGYARNIGMQKASGKWLVFSDSDDYFIPGFANTLDKYYSLEEDIIFLGAKCVMADNLEQQSLRGKYSRIRRYQRDGDLLKLLYMYTEPWGKMYNREFVLRNDFRFDEIPVCNDQFFSVQTQFSTDRIRVYDEPVYVYLSRKGSLSFGQKKTLENKKIRVRVGAKVLKFIQSKGYDVFPHPFTYFLILSKSPFVFFEYLKILREFKISIIRELGVALKTAIIELYKRILKKPFSDEVLVKKKI